MTDKTLTPDNLILIQASGRDYTKADSDRAKALDSFLIQVGDAPTYETWEAARKALILGYREIKPLATDNAADVWFSRYLAALKTYAGEIGTDVKVPAKPKAESPDAQRMAEKRANPFAGKTRAELNDALSIMPAASTDPAEAKMRLQAVEALAKVVKAENKATAKAEADKLKPRRDTIAKAVRTAPAHVLALVEAVIDLSADNATRATIDRAWSVLAALAPKPKAEATKARKAA